MKSLYPTIEHEQAAKRIVEIFSKDASIKTILLIRSCARGKATKDSCLDITLITKNIKNQDKIERKFNKLLKKEKAFLQLKKVGKFSHIDLLVRDGKPKIKKRDWTDGPDKYELEIGNTFIYVKVLFDKDNYFKKLRKKYVPYYSEKIRKKRLKEVKMYMLNNLAHIPLYIKRKLYFQAFDRLYNANQEFMQALFIKKRIYPIAYDKWIKEQFIEILKMPKLYKQIVDNIQIKKFESNEIAKKAKNLEKIAKKYLN